jgi:hypothetical protein
LPRRGGERVAHAREIIQVCKPVAAYISGAPIAACDRGAHVPMTESDLAPLALKVANLPDSPGVYLWKDAEGRVLYVGKAKRLRSRVRSYLSADRMESIKTMALMRSAVEVDTIVVPSEAHALILENNLIKEYRPRFNIALRDDKSDP